MDRSLSIADRVAVTDLAGGVRVHLLENHANTTVDIVGLLEGGLLREPPDLPGVADLTFSMLDRGTQRRDERAIAAALESNGAFLEYGLGPEVALVSARCLSEDLALLVEILGETLREPAFPEAQLALEREETLVALRESAFDTFDRAFRRAVGLLRGEHDPYACDPLGTQEVVARLTRADLAAHHGRAVFAEGLSLAVVGDIDPARTLDLLERNLAGLPRAAAVNPAPAAGAGATRPAAGAAGERIPIPDKEQVDIVVAGPGVSRADPDFEAVGVANFVFGGSFVSRLNQRLRDSAGLTYGAQSQIVSGRDSGCWFASAGVRPDSVERAIEMILAEMRRMADAGPDAAELEMAKQHLTGSFPIRLETNRAIASVLLESVRFGRGLDYIDRYPARIRGLTLEEVNAAARRLFDSPDPIVVAAGDVGRRA
jgi:zinc protease